MKDSVIGKCSHCCGTVLFLDDGTQGWRFCLGCMRRGPDVILTAEVPSEYDVEIDEDGSFEADDFTIVSEVPAEVMKLARRG